MTPETIERLHMLGVDPQDLRPFFSSCLSCVLFLDKGRLSWRSEPGAPRLVVDFLHGRWRRRAAGHVRNERLIKAVFGRHKTSDGPLRVVDATAGLGGDSFLMALAGAEVLAFERHLVVHALLADGLWRARQNPELAEAVNRIRLRAGDCLQQKPFPAGKVIYLDPMFPSRRKSAQVKKNMQALHRLVGVGQHDADRLLLSALRQSVAKVVVKRPRLAAPLAGKQPASQVVGKTNRFDVYIPE